MEASQAKLIDEKRDQPQEPITPSHITEKQFTTAMNDTTQDNNMLDCSTGSCAIADPASPLDEKTFWDIAYDTVSHSFFTDTHS